MKTYQFYIGWIAVISALAVISLMVINSKAECSSGNCPLASCINDSNCMGCRCIRHAPQAGFCS